MKLFFVTVGKAGYHGFDMLVHADSPSEAGKLWGEYFKGERSWRPMEVKVYDTSQLALCPGPLRWIDMPMTIVGAP